MEHTRNAIIIYHCVSNELSELMITYVPQQRIKRSAEYHGTRLITV